MSIEKKDNSKMIEFIQTISSGYNKSEMEHAVANFREFLLIIKKISDRIDDESNKPFDYSN